MSNHFFIYQEGTLKPVIGDVVKEFPLQLIVNGREIATLIASPHDLRFLVAGFLRLQGFVNQVTDFEMFSVCEDFGSANVRIKGELPERLKPVLTSGCGTGVSFSMPDVGQEAASAEDIVFQPAQIFSLMEQLAQRADNYRTHGGIHSAAIGRSGRMMLYAEDLGRHNTLDRIAGEALFKGINLAGTMLVTSGRVSTEMVAKAALLGIRLIASRTSPTDMAIELCRRSGICLVGYVRGGKFTVYNRPELIDPYAESNRIPGVTGVILAGGASRRMGTNKALLMVDGVPLIERVYRTMAPLFQEVLVVTNSPDEYAFLPCRTVPDIYPDTGAIAGLHAGLKVSGNELVFVTGCDMPSLSPEMIRLICTTDSGADAVVPVNREGLREPLHSLYKRSALPILEQVIAEGEKSILTLLDRLETRELGPESYSGIAAADESLRNVNTPEEFEEIARR